MTRGGSAGVPPLPPLPPPPTTLPLVMVKAYSPSQPSECLKDQRNLTDCGGSVYFQSSGEVLQKRWK